METVITISVRPLRRTGWFSRLVLRTVLVLMLVLPLGGTRPARAQFAVTDLAQIASNTKSSLAELAQLFKEVGISLDQLDWLDTIMDVAGQVENLMQDIGIFKTMYNSLTFQIAAMKNYAMMLADLQLRGIRGSTIAEIKSRMKMGYNSVKNIIMQAMKIIRDTGLSKADKLRMAQEYSERIEMEAWLNLADIEDDIMTLYGEVNMTQLDNLLSGNPPHEGLDLYSTDVQDTGMEEAFGEDSETIKAASRKGIAMFYTFLGVFLLFALIVVTVRFMQGHPGSESGFLKILIIIVIASVVFTVLQGVLKI